MRRSITAKVLTASAVSLTLLSAACGADGETSTSDVPSGASDTGTAAGDNDSEVPIGDSDATPGPGEGDTTAEPTDAASLEDAAAEDVGPGDATGLPDVLVTADTVGADVPSAADTSEPDASQPDTAAPVDAAEPADTGSPNDTTVADTGPDVVTPTCLTLAAGHPRYVVLSRPYDSSGGQAKQWETFPLEAEGTLGAPIETFAMGRAYYGKIAFRADGAVGAVAQDDGSLGVFALDSSGHATVIHSELDTGAYAETVQFDESGSTLYLVDPNWPNNGGGIYTAPIACDGTVGGATKLYETKLALDLILEGDAHLLAAMSAVTPDEGQVHRVTLGPSAYEHTAGVNVFGDTDQILSAFAVTQDRKFALVGDNSSFSDFDNRVGVVALTPGTALTKTQVLTPVQDPVQLIVSPYNNAVLVVSGYDDAVRVLSYDPDAAKPFVDVGEPTYIGQSPQLPGSGLLIGDSHPGVMLVIENVAVRRLRFEPSGAVTDLGMTALNDSFVGIPGAIGVQP